MMFMRYSPIIYITRTRTTNVDPAFMGDGGTRGIEGVDGKSNYTRGYVGKQNIFVGYATGYGNENKIKNFLLLKLGYISPIVEKLKQNFKQM